jgi:hypothetical protein
MVDKNEAHRQLEAVKKEAEKNSIEQAREVTTKMEELKRALLGSQQNVERLIAEQHQKHLDTAKQTEV